MKKILSLALVTILLMTSVFTGYVVSAEETPVDTTVTAWEEKYADRGLKIDETTPTGIYMGTLPMISHEDFPAFINGGNVNPDTGSRSATVGWNGYGSKYLAGWGGWYDNVWKSSQWDYCHAIAVGEGRTGREDDNALIIGMPVGDTIQMLKYIKVDSSKFTSGNEYRISFDAKIYDGALLQLHAGLTSSAPDSKSDSTNKLTCSNGAEIIRSEADGTALNNGGALLGTMYTTKPNAEDVYDYTDTSGYLGSDFTEGEWRNVVWTTTLTSDAGMFWINIIADKTEAGDNGCVLLVDNIKIQNTAGENLFVASNVKIQDSASTYSYEAIQNYLGTFDYNEGVKVEETIDPTKEYIPIPHFSNASAQIGTIDIAEKVGVNGSTAMKMKVRDTSSALARVRFQSSGAGATDKAVWIGDSTYCIEFAVKVAGGTVDKLNLTFTTNSKNSVFYPEYEFFGTVNGSQYNYKAYTETVATVYGDQLSTTEYRKFRVFVQSNPYAGVYRLLGFELYGSDVNAEIYIDELEVTNLTHNSKTIVQASMPLEYSSFDYGYTTTNDYLKLNGTQIIIANDTSMNSREIIDGMNIKNNKVWYYYLSPLTFNKYPDVVDIEGKTYQGIELEQFNAALAAYNGKTDNYDIKTGMVIAWTDRQSNHNYRKISSTYYIALKNDVNGDGLVNATDLVRAKRYILDIETVGEASDAQLAAAGVTEDGANITITEVGNIRADLMK